MEANYEAVMTLPEPESPLAAELHYYRGRRALREGRLDEATFSWLKPLLLQPTASTITNSTLNCYLK